jgi:ATP-dependent Lon protease
MEGTKELSDKGKQKLSECKRKKEKRKIQLKKKKNHCSSASSSDSSSEYTLSETSENSDSSLKIYFKKRKKSELESDCSEEHNEKISPLAKKRKLFHNKEETEEEVKETEEETEEEAKETEEEAKETEEEAKETEEETDEIEESEGTEELKCVISIIADKLKEELEEKSIPIILFNNENKSETKIEYPIFLTEEEKKKIEETEKKIKEMTKYELPHRFKILLSPMSLGSKVKVLNNMEKFSEMKHYSSEYSKLSCWINGVLSIPFGKYVSLPVHLMSPTRDISNYFNSIQETMDKYVYGQEQAKESILEFVGKWIANPSSANRPLSFVGEKGTGKTTLAKYGIAEALGRPFYMISLGGESDAASFKGHDYTYEGSRWGKIADILIHTRCMNPVIFFDELDKISETKSGEEIIGLLIHLTDITQNDKYKDVYFSGIDLDLSQVLFIFSYNDSSKINPILKDRIEEIHFTTFKTKEKIEIAKKFLIPKFCKNVGLSPNFHIPEHSIEELIKQYSPYDGGVRKLEKIIEKIFLRLNLVNLPQTLNLNYKDVKPIKKGKYFIINTKIIKKLLNGIQKEEFMSEAAKSMYS